MSMLYENTDYDNQFTSGIKIIQAAFINQSNYFQNELSILANELMINKTKIKELEQSNTLLYSEREEYEKTIQKLLSENSRLIRIIDRGESTERLPHKSKDLDIENKAIDLNAFSSLLESTKATLKKNRSENMVLKPKSFNQFHHQGNVNEHLNGNGINDNNNNIIRENIPKIKKNLRATSGVPSIAIDYDGNTKMRTTHRSFRDREHNREENFKTQPMIETKRGNASKEYNINDNTNQEQETYKKRKGNFFKKCRSIMAPKDYSQMIEIVRLANSYQITKQETYDRIIYLLEKRYPSFITEFEELLFPKET